MAEQGGAVAPVPGTPEYDAAMIAKFDSHQQAAPAPVLPESPASKPEGVPDKFWDPVKGSVRTEDLIKSYTELEKLRSQPAKNEPAPAGATLPDVGALQKAHYEALQKAIENPQDTVAITLATSAKAALDSATAAHEAAKAATPQVPAGKVDVNSLTEELQTNGSLSEESYGRLEGLGFPREIVDQYIAGQEAVHERTVNGVHTIFGGKDAFDAARVWAKTNMSEPDKQALNKAFEFGTQAELRLAADSLKARYQAATGTMGQLDFGGSNNNTPSSAGFQSRAEMTAAIRDPRYSKDEAYRASVEARIGNSTAF